MLKLYTAQNSICTQKVFLTLLEKNIPWESHYIDLFKNEQYSSEYLKINPKGVVPSLIHEGRAIIESTLICEYLDETYPQPPLMPATPYARSQMRLWSKHIDEGIFEATREISFSAMFREKMRSMTPEQRQGRFDNIGDPDRRARMIAGYEEGENSLYVAQGIFAFEKMFAHMEADLAPENQWLLGSQFTLADINVIPFAARLHNLGVLDVFTADRPLVRAWWERARSRPSYHGAIQSKLGPEQLEAMRGSGSNIRARIAGRRAEILRRKDGGY